MINQIIQRCKIKTAIYAFIYAKENPQYLKGKVLQILLTNTKLAQNILELNYHLLSQTQRLNIIKGLTDFYAYETLDKIENLTLYERTMLIHIMLNGPKDKEYGTDHRWIYIHALLYNDFISPYKITKYTDHLIKNNIIRYMFDFYQTINEYYKENIHVDNIWWLKYDAPRLEPYIIMSKLV